MANAVGRGERRTNRRVWRSDPAAFRKPFDFNLLYWGYRSVTIHEG
jgi:hypothetical protein